MAETNSIPLWVDIVVKLTPAVFTLVIGAVGAYIGFLQYRLSNDRMRLDLFERRLKAFESLQKSFRSIFQHGKVTSEALGEIHEARAQSRFLFGNDITDKIDELWKMAVDLHTLHLQLYDGQGGGLPVGNERTHVAKEHGDKLLIYLSHNDSVYALYDKYLQFEHGRVGL